MKHCTQCGKEVKKKAKFCRHCSAELRVSKPKATPSKHSKKNQGKGEHPRAQKFDKAHKKWTKALGPVPEGFGSLLGYILHDTWKSFLRQLPISFLIVVGVWVLHCYVVVVLLNGFNANNALHAAFFAIKGQIISGTLIFFIASALIAGLIRRSGASGALDFEARIATVCAYFRVVPLDALMVFTAGVGLSLAVGGLLNGAGSVFAALGVGAMLASRGGAVVALLFRAFWISAFTSLRRENAARYAMAAGYVTLLAATIGFGAGVLIGDNSLTVGASILAITAVLTGMRSGSSTAVVLFSVATAAAMVFLPGIGLADDGGWKEAQDFCSDEPFNCWIQAERKTLTKIPPELPPIITTMIFSLSPAIAAAFGAVFSNVLIDLSRGLPEGKLVDFGSANEQQKPPRRNKRAKPRSQSREDAEPVLPISDAAQPSDFDQPTPLSQDPPPRIDDPRDGTPFETNDNGEYLAPDKKGEWRWLTETETRKSAAALSKEVSVRKGEIKGHLSKTDKILERSHKKILAGHVEDLEEERKRKVAAEQKRKHRDKLSDVIEKTLLGLPEEGRYQAVMAELGEVQARGDTKAMESLWKEIRGERQIQLDRLQEASNVYQRQSAGLGALEVAATATRDISKGAMAMGLGAVSSGSLTALEAAVVTATSSSGLIAEGAFSQGLKVTKDGQIRFDNFEAKRGAARGARTAIGALVGGVPTNGSMLTALGKVGFSATSDAAQTFADVHNKTGDRDKAGSKAVIALGLGATQSALGEAYGETHRLSAQRAQASNIAEGLHNTGNSTWFDVIAANEQKVNAAGKKATDLLGSIISNMAVKDQDFGTAVNNSVKGELKKSVSGRLGNAYDKPNLTSAQRAVADRLQAERMGKRIKPTVTPEYQEYLQNRTLHKHSTVRPGSENDYVPAKNQKGDVQGYTETARRYAQMVADKMGVKFHSRPSGPYAREHLESRRALPKNDQVKNKTAKMIDIPLGLKPENMGLAAHFKPKLPPRGERSDLQWNSLKERFKQRMDEYKGNNKIIADNPHIDLKGQLVVDTITRKPFAGDKDMFDVRGLHNETLPEAVVQNAMRQLRRHPEYTNVMHGEHMGWNYSGYDNKVKGDDNMTAYERARNIDQTIRKKHSVGGEPLVVFEGGEGMGLPENNADYFVGEGSKGNEESDDQ